MYRITFFLFIFVLLLPHSNAGASEKNLNLPKAFESRKVIGVIYFHKNSVKLSKTQKAELDRIASLVVMKNLNNKIVRVEGFTAKRKQRDPLSISLSRAKSVWHYLEKMDSFSSINLYLTGFSVKQSISKLQGERVEIALYENLFTDNKEIYSSN